MQAIGKDLTSEQIADACRKHRSEVVNLLLSDPKEASEAALATWRRLGPMTIETFEELGIKENISFDATTFKMKKFDDTKRPHIGQMDAHSGLKHGIVRAIAGPGGLFEGQFIRGKKYGYGREIFADGGYLTATYQIDKFNGLVTHFDKEGNVTSQMEMTEKL